MPSTIQIIPFMKPGDDMRNIADGIISAQSAFIPEAYPHEYNYVRNYKV